MAISEHPGLLGWSQLSDQAQQNARALINDVVHSDVDRFAAKFYSNFLAHEEASAYLSHSVVSERLNQSLRNWLVDLVQFDPRTELAEFNARQVKIGEIHARLKIPNHLVMEGMTLLKTEISSEIAKRGVDMTSATQAIILLGESVDYAMRLMTAAYVTDTKRRVQTDEAFRLFSLGQDINLERETQRAALMEWSEGVLFGLLGHSFSACTEPLSASQFGLWVRHRASVLFNGSATLATIEALITTIDRDVLAMVNHDKAKAVSELRRIIEEIKFHLNYLFQMAANVENGRDPLTRTLNRRFLPTVLGREISLAKSSKIPLSVLMADIDHFKHINDTYGHSSGDTALSHTAEILLNAVRASDFVFRYGGEEFLIVLVETTSEEAREIADRIRDQVASSSITINERDRLSITMSIGVASYEGHPDYQYLINAADRALYSAKNGGRNRVVVADAA